MRKFTVLFVTTLFVLVLAATAALAAGPANSKQQFLADKHLALGLTCKNCHGEKTGGDVPKETCLSCHGSYQEIAKKTASLARNPHDSHYTDLECTTCHHGHKEQEDFCGTCHNGQ